MLAGIGLLSFLGHGLSAGAFHRRMGGAPIPWRHRWMLWGIILLAPAVVVSTWRGSVEWRGRRYRLGANATLHMTHEEPS